GPTLMTDMTHPLLACGARGISAGAMVGGPLAHANGVRDIVGNALSGASYGRTVSTVAWAFIVALGVIAALGQAGIATAITGPVLIAALATVTGVLVVGVGGGLIMPMRQRWERWLDSAEQETARLRGTAYQAGRSDALANQPIRPTTQTGPGNPPVPGIDPGENR
ncbi:hypothetical protein ACFWXO_26715, partial [Kitasatospora sp. NPDC059088]